MQFLLASTRPRARRVVPPVGGGGDTTYLGTQAAALAAGTWVELTGMGGLNWALVESSSSSILDYCNKGANDYPGGRLLFQGGAHGGTGGLTGCIRYIKSTNQWDQITPSYSATLSHAWDSETYDPATGDFYCYTKTSGDFRCLNSGSTTWRDIASLSGEVAESVSLTWDETRNGLICWGRNTGCSFWAKNAGTGSWSSIGDPGIAGSLGMASHYMRTTQELFLADGSTNPTKYWLLNQAGSFTTSFTAPLTVYASEGGANMTMYDWATARLLVVDPETAESRAFNPNGRTWKTFTPSNGAFPFTSNPTGTFSIALDDLGCIFFMKGMSNGADPKAYLYRHLTSLEA